MALFLCFPTTEKTPEMTTNSYLSCLQAANYSEEQCEQSDGDNKCIVEDLVPCTNYSVSISVVNVAGDNSSPVNGGNQTGIAGLSCYFALFWKWSFLILCLRA